MSGDLSDQLRDAIDWAIRVISGLGFFVPIAIFALVNIFSNKDKKKREAQRSPTQPAPPQTRPQSTIPEFEPIPVGPFTWPDTEPVTTPTPTANRSRAGFDRDDAYRHEDSSLQWGSAFAANDAEKAGSAFRWGSVFDDQREQTKWGWDESEWGGDYDHRRDAEPKITVG